MHLSFVNYDREDSWPHEHGKQTTKKQGGNNPILQSNWLDSYEIAANGFLRPKIDPSSIRAKNPNGGASRMPKSPTSSFSALGNAAATPGKAKSPQQLQLISGRDFRDILEACKPRLSGMRMPSSLIYLLKLHQLSIETEKARLSGSEVKIRKSSSSKDIPLREWGTVDFADITIHAKSKLGRSDSPSSRRMSPELLLERSEGSESGGSNSSSFASHVSSMFGMSYDRVLWEAGESPSTTKKAIQIQRSPSLEFEPLGTPLPIDSDTVLSEDTISLSSSRGSKGSSGRLSGGAVEEMPAENETPSSLVAKREKHIENLRKLMEAHDTRLCTPAAAQVDANEVNLSRHESNYPSDSEQNASSRSGFSQNR